MWTFLLRGWWIWNSLTFANLTRPTGTSGCIYLGRCIGIMQNRPRLIMNVRSQTQIRRVARSKAFSYGANWNLKTIRSSYGGCALSVSCVYRRSVGVARIASYAIGTITNYTCVVFGISADLVLRWLARGSTFVNYSSFQRMRNSVVIRLRFFAHVWSKNLCACVGARVRVLWSEIFRFICWR